MISCFVAAVLGMPQHACCLKEYGYACIFRSSCVYNAMLHSQPGRLVSVLNTLLDVLTTNRRMLCRILMCLSVYRLRRPHLCMTCMYVGLPPGGVHLPDGHPGPP